MGKKGAKKRKGTKGAKAEKAAGGEEDDMIELKAEHVAMDDEAVEEDGGDGAEEQQNHADNTSAQDDDEEDEEKAEAPARKTKARRIEEALAKVDEDAEPRGVIYLGHIPKGFFEPQMKKFFSQFGKITRMRLSRSKKNAGSKGFAFIEFEEEGVAKIVANTMHKYLLFGKQLVCHLVPKEKQHPALFKGWKRTMINQAPSRRRKAREAYNNRPHVEVEGEMLPQVTLRQAAKQRKADKKLGKLLQHLDVDYDLSEVAQGSRPQQGEKEVPPAAPTDGVGPVVVARGKKRRQCSEAIQVPVLSAPEAAPPVEAKPAMVSTKAQKKRKA